MLTNKKPVKDAESPVNTKVVASVKSPQTKTRVVQTNITETVVNTNTSNIIITEPSETGGTVDHDDLELVKIQEAAERTTALHDLLNDPTPSRDVTTDKAKTFRSPVDQDTNDNVLKDPTPTPRTVTTKESTTDREPSVLEVAKTLLQLHGTENLDITKDNEQLLPVDAPKQPDVVKEMASTLGDSLPNLPSVYGAPDDNDDEHDEDDNATVIYEPPVVPARENTSVTSPKCGQVTFKHYGIRRRSPKQTNIRKHRCVLCSKSRDSKKELNDHHRKEHSGVTCPTCNKEFPMTDLFQRHRYIHRNPTQYKCAVCDKILPFESDLQRHMKTHTEEKKWDCTHPNCDRNFKWKADLDLHMVVHSGIKHKCTWPGCKYSNLDARNVKRHQKSHTQKATIQCTKCEKMFVFYMQMKRHRDQDH